MRSATLLLPLLAACGGAPAPAARAPELLAAAARVPERSGLPCFPCHSQVRFEKGPPFPHALVAHRRAGHCHLCHVGTGHHGREIDRTACLTCHEQGSELLGHLARSGNGDK